MLPANYVVAEHKLILRHKYCQYNNLYYSTTANAAVAAASGIMLFGDCAKTSPYSTFTDRQRSTDNSCRFFLLQTPLGSGRGEAVKLMLTLE